jgi:hypothetical protein
MTQYAKIVDGSLIVNPNSVYIGKVLYSNPQEEHYISAGFKPYRMVWDYSSSLVETDEEIVHTFDMTPTNEEIGRQREFAYKEESDNLFIAWQKYLQLNEVDKAEASRIAWLAKIEEIDLRLPYNE